MALSAYLAKKLLDHIHGRTSFTMPADVFLGLFTAAPTYNTSGTETTYTSYARVTVEGTVFAAAADGDGTPAASAANASAIAFPAKTGGADPTLTHWATFDASTAGNMLEFGALTASKVIADGDTPTFAIGTLVSEAT